MEPQKFDCPSIIGELRRGAKLAMRHHGAAVRGMAKWLQGKSHLTHCRYHSYPMAYVFLFLLAPGGQIRTIQWRLVSHQQEASARTLPPHFRASAMQASVLWRRPLARGIPFPRRSHTDHAETTRRRTHGHAQGIMVGRWKITGAHYLHLILPYHHHELCYVISLLIL